MEANGIIQLIEQFKDPLHATVAVVLVFVIGIVAWFVKSTHEEDL